jgi:hypothetical protein
MFLVLSQTQAVHALMGMSGGANMYCSKNQCWGSRRLMGVNGGYVLCFDQCMVRNINAPASPVEHAFYGMTSCDSPGCAMVPKAKHTSWKKSLSCLALESLRWSEHCKSNQARHAFNLPHDCYDYLDWNKISTKKTYHNRTRHSSLKRVKSSFSWITSCVQLSWHIRFTLIFYCARKKVGHTAHLISSDTIQYRAVSKTIAYGVHLVTTFVSVVVVMSGFDLCWTQLVSFLCIW